MNKSLTVGPEATSPRASYLDVVEASPYRVAEVVDGKFYLNARPPLRQCLAQTHLSCWAFTTFKDDRHRPGGWRIWREPELHFDEDIVVPNVCGYRTKRMPDYPINAYICLAPDWVCEFLEPATRELDLVTKSAVYAREGVKYFWIIDTDVRTLEAFELCGREWVLIDSLYDDASVSLPPFADVSFDLGDLWPYPADTEASRRGPLSALKPAGIS